jgi:hypothetical protein
VKPAAGQLLFLEGGLGDVHQVSSMKGCLSASGKGGHTERKDIVKTQVGCLGNRQDEIRLMQLQVKECRAWLATTRSWKRQRRILPRVCEGAWLYRHFESSEL